MGVIGRARRLCAETDSFPVQLPVIEMNANHRQVGAQVIAEMAHAFLVTHPQQECPMRRIISILLVSALLLIGSASLTGCVVVPARGYPARVWVPGYWGPTHVWVGGYWRNH